MSQPRTGDVQPLPGAVERHQNASLELLEHIIEVTSADLDVHEVSQRVAALVTAATKSDVCFVHLVDEDLRRVVLVGATPPFDQQVGNVQLALGEGIAGWVARNAQPAVVPNKWQDARYRYIPELRGEDFTSMVSVPMLVRARVVGVLNVHSRLARNYGEDDLLLLTQVANLMARAIENARLYRRLAEREELLERFATRTVEAQELERRRLAGEIHDGISQRLVSLWYHLLAAEDALGGGEPPGQHRGGEPPGQPGGGEPPDQHGGGEPPGQHGGGEPPDQHGGGEPPGGMPDTDRVRRELATAKALATDALAEARAAITGLRPFVLDDLGLGPGLESLGRSLRGVEVEVEVEPVDLPGHVEVALYRIAQEALQNVVKHAEATTVRLRLASEEEGVRLVISDDGRGFDLDEQAGVEDRHSYGLVGIRERAELIGASLHLTSRPGTGTTVEVIVASTDEPGIVGRSREKNPESDKKV